MVNEEVPFFSGVGAFRLMAQSSVMLVGCCLNPAGFGAGSEV